MPDTFEAIQSSESTRAFARSLGAGRPAVARGGAGSSSTFVAASIAHVTERPVLLVVAHLDDADTTTDELESLGLDALRLPALELVPGESHVSLELFAERIGVIRRLLGPERPDVVVASIHALMQGVPAPHDLASVSRTIAPHDRLEPGDLVRWLDAAGYKRLDAVEEPGDFAVRGGIIDIFVPGADSVPVRLDFFGDEVDSIVEFDLETMGSDRRIDRVELVTADLEHARSVGAVCLADLLPPDTITLLCETMELTEQGRGYYERVSGDESIFGPPRVFKALRERSRALGEINQFSAGAEEGERFDIPASVLPALADDVADAVRDLARLDVDEVHVCCQNEGERLRMAELVEEHARDAHIKPIVRFVHRGFIWHEPKRLAIVPYHELLHRFTTRRRTRRLRAGRAMDTFLDFAPGDYVVHAEYGIARFVGLQMMSRGAKSAPWPAARRRAGAIQEEFLTLEFAKGDKLHVPATRIDIVQKYVGGFHAKPKLSTLGGRAWKRQTELVAESVKDLAGELLRVRAAREAMSGIRYPADTTWQREFEAEFPYDETEDQLAALAAIKRDMQSGRPMDRLVCGDVGFGKTELAIRAAFKAVEFGKQVGVLVPTTVLAEQHERTFRDRFADYPFRIESISRFKTGAEANAVLKALRKGQVDVIIGTHRVLSKDVHFADLGLVIIDEEQRFGVEHKESLLQLRLTADVLTLSATPIPRTLHMSLLGLRDISSLATAPADRQAVVTDVVPYNPKRIAQAIQRELARDGQIFYVHNRVHDIRSVADEVRRLAPEGTRILVGHGQMPARELERVMLAFMRRQADILVCTTIIESGIDIPTANTMFIDDADRYGLADLHQLRGRVGRYKHRAYCYLLLPMTRTLSDVAKKRLKAIEQFSMLGAGFKIAMRDLELRGAGNLLGAEQSGHIAAVGYDMYCRLLERAVKELNQERTAETSDTTVEIGLTGHIPRTYIPSDARRMDAYRRIAVAGTHDELDKVEHDLTDAYARPPDAVTRLIELAHVRIGAVALGVRSISIRDDDVVFRTDDPAPIAQAMGQAKGTVRILPPKPGESYHEVFYRPPPAYLEPTSLLRILRARLTTAPHTPAVATTA
jgi:transcription-repair coupling factor (superfamily II helicase)